VGVPEGISEGDGDGAYVCCDSRVGGFDGEGDGTAVGTYDGAAVGVSVGSVVGVDVGE